MENEIYESIPEVEEIEPVEEVTEPTLHEDSSQKEVNRNGYETN